MSSRDAVYNGSRDDSTRGAQTATFHNIPSNPTYNLDRFVSGNDRSVPTPSSCGPTEAKAIAQSEARASATIDAFNQQFSSANRPPHQ
ncbi:hypothetical protein N5P37_010532 [Trichoderma harzianum]|uniref:Uncharacterized protein n=1 Tax=Trichoderma harzianum CBS 226.95 TaxID=983964 RepID=A0A2T4A0U1_TRIHA|nr:hypothetical protein M431DRAFT_124559 [Trichoderma harzianum CBS 226.95]KAK0757006.1 hypothetical protein N5P37_010532 [Trichoderma harzianum]PKK44402.1 hypothetical protein CI102_12027 [Trichoderma harzianum]PTB50593.1 hypothetical protein M431DRAFT_124559 [Trichoderma harzianum CBS 226.95]